MEPVSSRDFRLEMIFGQPPDTASINFEGSRSMEWVMESLTAVPLGSSSIVHCDCVSGEQIAYEFIRRGERRSWRSRCAAVACAITFPSWPAGALRFKIILARCKSVRY